jgi:hypothetical protein
MFNMTASLTPVNHSTKGTDVPTYTRGGYNGHHYKLPISQSTPYGGGNGEISNDPGVKPSQYKTENNKKSSQEKSPQVVEIVANALEPLNPPQEVKVEGGIEIKWKALASLCVILAVIAFVTAAILFAPLIGAAVGSVLAMGIGAAAIVSIYCWRKST